MPPNQELPTDADNPTETRVACASCHFGFTATHVGATDPMAYGQFANPDVCGQCHDQRSQAVSQYPVFNPTPPPDTILTTLRYPVAYDPFTTLLPSVMNIGSQMTTWPGGYAQNIHEFNAVQYNEMSEGWYTGALPAPLDTPITHFNSWTMLNTLVPDVGVSANEKINFCGHCMSADQRILVEAGKLNVHPDSPQTPPTDSNGAAVTKDQIKFGDTCVACHDPHAKGGQASVWNPSRNPQIIQETTTIEGQTIPVTRATLCGTCHNGELAAGQTSFAPGAEINHPTEEFMNGIGAIDVPRMPALHKGMCVQCHMVPTGFDREGNVATGGNHIFTPIMPTTAMNNTYTFTPTGATDPITVHMPYSACSTCHEGTNGDNPAKTEAMQQIIDQRQQWTSDMVDAVTATLDAKAVQMGFADAEAAVADADVAELRLRQGLDQHGACGPGRQHGRPQLAVWRGRHQQGHGAGRRLQGAGRRCDHHRECGHGHVRPDAHALWHGHHSDRWSCPDGRRSGATVDQRDAGELRDAQRRQLHLHRHQAEQEHDLRHPVRGRRQLRAHRRRQHQASRSPTG